MTHPSTTGKGRLPIDPEVYALVEPHYRLAIDHRKIAEEAERVVGAILAAHFEGFRTRAYGFDFETREFYPMKEEANDS